jgi:hypothetical protein
MRLAQDPLLLHEHLQSRERETPADLKTVSGWSGSKVRLQTLGGRKFDHRAAEAMDHDREQPICPGRENLFEPSLHPEAFAALDEDRKAAIDQVLRFWPSDDGSTMPPMLVGGILVVFGLVLLAAFV